MSKPYEGSPAKDRGTMAKCHQASPLLRLFVRQMRGRESGCGALICTRRKSVATTTLFPLPSTPCYSELQFQSHVCDNSSLIPSPLLAPCFQSASKREQKEK